MAKEIPDKIQVQQDAVIQNLLDEGFNYGQINTFLKATVNIFFKKDAEALANKGYADVTIKKKLNVSYSKVSKVTAEYWENKMKAKADEEKCIK